MFQSSTAVVCIYFDVYDGSPARVLSSTVSSLMPTMAHTPVYELYSGLLSQIFNMKIIITARFLYEDRLGSETFMRSSAVIGYIYVHYKELMFVCNSIYYIHCTQ